MSTTPLLSDAAVMYGKTTPTTETKSTGGSIPGEPRKDSARVLYDSPEAARQTFEKTIDASAAALGSVGITADMRKAQLTAFTEIHKSGVPYHLANDILRANLSALISDHQGAPLEESQWREQADKVRQSVIGTYGLEAGEKLLERTEAVIGRIPALSEAMSRRDVGVQFFGRLVDLVHQGWL